MLFYHVLSVLVFAPMFLQLLPWRSRLQIPFREPSFVSGLMSPEREPQRSTRIATGDHSELRMCFSYWSQIWIPCQLCFRGACGCESVLSDTTNHASHKNINKRREENGTLKELRASVREKDPKIPKSPHFFQDHTMSNPQTPYADFAWCQTPCVGSASQFLIGGNRMSF